eukprot:scaffold321827_cov36-Tisochrysis_lutea.AAC.2
MNITSCGIDSLRVLRVRPNKPACLGRLRSSLRGLGRSFPVTMAMPGGEIELSLATRHPTDASSTDSSSTVWAPCPVPSTNATSPKVADGMEAAAGFVN